MNNSEIKVSPKIAILAGEASGDQLGADLAKQLLALYPTASIQGVGADKMLVAGVRCWWHSDQLAVFGLVEVLQHVPRLLKLRGQLLTRLLNWKPDIVISIDAPDFYLPLAKQLKSHGIKVVHYVCPSVWAWRQNRVKKLRRSIDHVLCLLPFEQAFLSQHQVSATFVGHPLALNMGSNAKQKHACDTNKTVIAVLPGSRDGEIKRHTDIFFQACQVLKSRLNQPLKLIISTAKPAHQKILKLAHQQHCPMLELELVEDTKTALQAADVTLLASGTVTLEAMLYVCPMVVAYRLNALTWQILQKARLYKANHVALPNLLANTPIDQRLVPELLQDEANPENLAEALYQALQQDLNVYRERCELLTKQLSTQCTPAAEVVNRLLQEQC